ncbi:MAG: ABC transporter ATP-binding protein, partial [Prochlorococcus sp. MED105]|nr:ABC transporter ATP-binding protein [Prochlorococcus sp. MED105]
RLGVGRKFQSPRVFENLTVKENLEISVSTPKSPLNLINKKIKNDQLDEIEHLMKVINLSKKINSKAGALSHGQKQWLEIAMLLGQKPDLMLVDEPVAGLTDEETDLTADLLKSLSGENTVVVIDHDMEFIRRLDSNVSVLNQGTVLCEGTMDTIQNDKRVIDVYLGRPEE